MLPNHLLKSCGALSLSLSLLAGCASPVTPPPTETTPVVVADSPAAQPTAQPAAPAAVAPTTLDGKVIFKGQPVAGYAVTVYDARTNLPLERKADLSGATGLAVLDQNLVTDAQGGFKLQVVGLTPGQALRVVASKGNTSLEAIVSSELQTLGAKQRRVLATDVTLTLSELTTAMAKIARNVVLTTQVLTPEAAGPVLAKLMADLDALSAKLDEQLKQMPAMADELTQAESADTIGKAEAGALNVLISNAGLLKETTRVVAELVAEIAKQSKDPASRSTAAADPKLVEALAKVEYVGTVLTGALDGTDGTFSLVNGVTGGKIDASTGIGTIADRVTPNHSANRAPISREAHVTNEQELRDALQNASITTIFLDNTINLAGDSTLSIDRAVTIDGGLGLIPFALTSYHPLPYRVLTTIPDPATIEVASSGVTMKNLSITCPVLVSAADANGTVFSHITFSRLAPDLTPYVRVEAQSKAMFSYCTFNGSITQTGFGLDAEGDIQITDSTFSNLAKAIAISPSTPHAPVISDSTFLMNKTSIYFGSGNITTTNVAAIDGNTFSNYLLIDIGISYQAASSGAIELILGTQNNFMTFLNTAGQLEWRSN